MTTRQRTGRYVDTELSPRNLEKIWGEINQLTDLLRTLQTTQADQTGLFADLQTQVTEAARDARKAQAQASQLVLLNGLPGELPGGSTVGGGTSGGGTPVEDFTIPARLDVVEAVITSLGGPSALLTLADLFKVPQMVAWELRNQTIDGMDFPAGLLLKAGGENVYTCGGETYSVSRICFPNGHIIKIMAAVGPWGPPDVTNAPQWVDDGFVPAERYHIATDPSLPC